MSFQTPSFLNSGSIPGWRDSPGARRASASVDEYDSQAPLPGGDRGRAPRGPCADDQNVTLEDRHAVQIDKGRTASYLQSLPFTRSARPTEVMLALDKHRL